MKKIIGLSLGALIAAVTFPVNADNLHDFFSRTSAWAKGHWDVPSNERLAYAVRPTAAPFPGETFFVEPDNDFDFAFGIEHALPMGDANTHLNVVLDYDAYATSQSDTKSGVSFHSAFDNMGVVPGPQAGASYQGSIDLKDMTWRLGVRRAKEWGRFDWQLGVFAEYSKLERVYSIIDSCPTCVAPVVRGAQFFSKQQTKWWGPSFDIIGRLYPWGRDTGFSLFGMGETAFLYADQSLKTISTANGALLTQSSSNRTDLNVVTTRLGASVGLGYARPISEDLMVGFKVGGRWLNYYNAFKNFSNLDGGRTDYGRAGPFLELRVGGTHSAM